MKYLLIFNLFLVGCGSFYNPDNIQFGDKVQVTSGMYKGCTGYVTDSIDRLVPCQREFVLKPFQCPKGSKTFEIISVCDLKRVNTQ